MKAKITVEDQRGDTFVQSTIEEAQIEHLFTEFRTVVTDFRAVCREPRWQIRVEVEDA